MRKRRIFEDEFCCHGKGNVTVKYKVLIKKCENAAKASRIAEEIARWSGSSMDTVLNNLVAKPICVRQEAEEQEAIKIKAQFEAVGAEVVALEADALGVRHHLLHGLVAVHFLREVAEIRQRAEVRWLPRRL